jgi:membrane-associated HD superfamily phosphohydrolase
VATLRRRRAQHWGGRSFVKVGAYFHDIGKLKRPLMFKETR